MTKTPTNAPTAPAKKPLSGYFQFMKENRAKVKEENPDASSPKMAQLMGAMWRELTPVQKEGYTARGKQVC